MTTAYEVPPFEALPGDAAALRQHAHRYDEIAQAIADVAAQLDVMGDENATIGDAADALRERVRDASTRLDDVEPRYVSTAIGVSEFAVALADSQTRANQAIAERNEIVDALIQLYGESHEQVEAIRRAGYEGTISQELLDSHRATLRRISEREDRLYEVWMAYLDADQRRHDAATAAASRIVAGALGSTDNFLDHLAA